MGIRLEQLSPQAQAQVRRQLGIEEPATAGNRSPAPTGKLSELEMHFDALLKTHGKDIPVPTPEYRFAAPRHYRFDRAWLKAHVAVELDGGVMTNGRHVRGAGFTEDCRKLNLATALGWSVLRFTSEMLVKDPLACLAQIRTLLEEKQ